MTYIYFILNYTYNATTQNIPLNTATGTTCDIFPLLRFHFWQPIYFLDSKSSFPNDTNEIQGRFVGISENAGHNMTFHIFNPGTNKLINQSFVRPVNNITAPNLRADPINPPEIVTSLHEPDDSSSVPKQGQAMPILDPSNLVGRTFLLNKEGGQRLRARIVKALDDYEGELSRDSSRMRFVCSMQDDTVEEIFTHNELLDYINNSEEDDLVEWKFREILAHEGPLPKSHPNYNGSTYNLQIEWESGEITNEPLNIIASDEPVSCAMHGKKHDLLDKPGWKRFKALARRNKNLLRLMNQVKIQSHR